MSIECKIAEAAKEAAETVRAKSDEVKRKEEAVRTQARLTGLARRAEEQSQMRQLIDHERYRG